MQRHAKSWHKNKNAPVMHKINVTWSVQRKFIRHKMTKVSWRSTKDSWKKGNTACLWHVLWNDLSDKYWPHFHHNHIQVTSFLSGWQWLHIHDLISVNKVTPSFYCSSFYNGEIIAHRTKKKQGILLLRIWTFLPP